MLVYSFLIYVTYFWIILNNPSFTLELVSLYKYFTLKAFIKRNSFNSRKKWLLRGKTDLQFLILYLHQWSNIN